MSNINSPFAVYETNPEKEKTGVWLDFGAYGFKVRRAGPQNIKYTKALERAQRPHKAAIRRGKLDPDIAVRLARKVFCETVLVDWRKTVEGKTTEGVMVGSDGADVPFSIPSAIELFTLLPDLLDDVYDASSDVSSFAFDADEETAKN